MGRDEATVSYTMSRIRGKDTSIEIKLRKALYDRGCRYRCNSKYIFGHPDISFKGVKVVVFADSEFWHGKDFDENEQKIKNNTAYWIPKIRRNIERDHEVNERLWKEGYLIYRFWGNDLNKHLFECVNQVIEGLKSRGYEFKKRTIETERLILRNFEESDAESIYEQAKNPNVGPIAGWNPHLSLEETKAIIKTILLDNETYAVCLKKDGKAIGSISLYKPTFKADGEDLEILYWIGEPFWGNGYIPEAIKALIGRAFKTLHAKGLWCGYYDGDEKSKRCQEKCGFVYHHTEHDKYCPITKDVRTEHFTYISNKKKR